MMNFLNEIRKPVKISLSRKFVYSTLIFIIGVILGLISKVLDETASNLLPYFLEILDLRNFFSRMGVWIFLAVLISVNSKSPVRSGINVFLFFSGMLFSYYLYTAMIAGFFDISYTMIWVTITVISPLLAFICWYAKGKGIISISISSIIIMFISRQVFAFGFWYFSIINNLELLVWIAMIFVLYQSPKQIMRVIAIGMLLYFVTAQINLLWGMV